MGRRVKRREAIARPARGRHAFGDGWVLDTVVHELLDRDGAVVPLAPRAQELLGLLVAHAGELLERDALIETLWPDVVVDDNNLSQLVVQLRRAVGDTSPPRLIQTVPRRGFRLAAPVRRLPESAPAAGPAAPAGAVAWVVAGVAAAERPTLAVLPFRALAAADHDEVLQVGLADLLITRLSAVPGLAVRSIASVRRFVAGDVDPLEAARQLDAAWVLEGTVQRRGDRIRGSARLLRRADGTAAWSDIFDERADDVFVAQDALGRRVLAVLGPQLGGLPAEVPSSPPADALQLYLAARLHAQGVDARGLARSAELFERASALAPGFALADAGLSETRRRTVFGADADPAVALPLARAAAERALACDPRLALAQGTLGWVAFWHDRDWARAEALFREALVLGASVAEVHLGLAHLLMCTGRMDEALAHLAQARLADPLSPLMNVMEAQGLAAAGQRQTASRRLRIALDIEPDFWIALLTLAGERVAAGDWAEAERLARRAVAVSDGRTQALLVLVRMLAAGGQPAEARRHFERLREAAATRYVAPTALASMLDALGEPQAALDLLEAGFDGRDAHMAYLRLRRSGFPRLQGEPRWHALLARLRLDDASLGRSGS